MVIIQGESRNRNTWKLGVVQALIVGRNGLVRRSKLRARKGALKRAIQHLYPLELSVDRSLLQPQTQLNPEVPHFRLKCAAAEKMNQRIKEIAQEYEL